MFIYSSRADQSRSALVRFAFTELPKNWGNWWTTFDTILSHAWSVTCTFIQMTSKIFWRLGRCYVCGACLNEMRFLDLWELIPNHLLVVDWNLCYLCLLTEMWCHWYWLQTLQAVVFVFDYPALITQWLETRKPFGLRRLGQEHDVQCPVDDFICTAVVDVETIWENGLQWTLALHWLHVLFSNKRQHFL